MSKTFPVTIQTKPYLKKYLHTLYGKPLIFTQDNLFGITVAAFLFRETLVVKSHQNKELLKNRFDRLDDSIEIYLPMTFLTKRRGGYEITAQHVITVNKLFERRFEEDLWKTCLMMGISGVEKKVAIEEFCQTYDIVTDAIDEDITMDALKKKEERYGNKMKSTAPTLSVDRFNARVKYLKKPDRTMPDVVFA